MEEGVPEAEDLLHPKEVAEKAKDNKQEQEAKGANDGILNNLKSNLMGPTTTTTVVDQDGENSKKLECEDEDEKKRENPGVGILEKIISHLPGEDEVPTTDEAAILIHSVID